MLFSNISVLTDKGVCENMYVGVDGERITYVSKNEPGENYGRTYDGKGKMLIPGLANTHCHVAMTLLRGFAEDQPLDRWLNEKIFPMETKLNNDDAYWGSMLGIAEMLKNGITSFSDMYILCDGVAKAAIDSGIKCNFSYGITDANNSGIVKNGQLELLKRLYKDYHGTDGRIKMDVALHAVYSTSSKAVDEAVSFAAENDLNLQIHLSETKKELKNCIKEHGVTPTQYFYSHKVFELPVTAAHCVTVTEEDIDILSQCGVNVSHCPASNLKLGSGIAPIVKMFDKGVNISIGTDGAASNNRLDIIRDASLAAMLQKGISGDPSVMNVLDVVDMISRNGYKSQGREPIKIKVGNQADLAVIDLKRSLRPCGSDLLYASDSSDVCLTMINGRVLYENGEYTSIDLEHITEKIGSIRKKLQ